MRRRPWSTARRPCATCSSARTTACARPPRCALLCTAVVSHCVLALLPISCVLGGVYRPVMVLAGRQRIAVCCMHMY